MMQTTTTPTTPDATTVLLEVRGHLRAGLAILDARLRAGDRDTATSSRGTSSSRRRAVSAGEGRP